MADQDELKKTAGPDTSADQLGMWSVVAQSYVIAATSSLRYLSGIAQTFVAHQSDISSVLLAAARNKHLSKEDQAVVAESIRAYLREIGDLAEQQARLLQVELARVGETLADGTSPEGETPNHQRRWKVKP